MVFGSQSYNYTIPILRLPGRAGMDLVLNLYYNSRIWNVDASNGVVAFNADRDFPSYGFRLDFGYIEWNADGSYTLTERDGTKRPLLSSGGGLYYSTDGTHVQFNSQTYTLTYRNRVAVKYESFPSNINALLRPISMSDTNGNCINISYVSGHDQFINKITDTVGRVITFNYDASNHLISLTQPTHPSGTKTWVTFTWN